MAVCTISLVDDPTLSFKMGIRGFHVYQEKWKPFIGQELSFVQEADNVYDCFAVAVKTKCKGSLAPQEIVGHVPLELSRFIFFAIQHGCSFSAKVLTQKPVRSPLVQGGLEVVCAVSASWSNCAGLAVLEQVTGSKYSVDNNEKDDSTEILKNIGDVLKIDGHHPQSEELEEAAIESDTDIIMIPRDEN